MKPILCIAVSPVIHVAFARLLRTAPDASPEMVKKSIPKNIFFVHVLCAKKRVNGFKPRRDGTSPAVLICVATACKIADSIKSWLVCTSQHCWPLFRIYLLFAVLRNKGGDYVRT
jgi:hypothetical protein